MEIVVWFIFRKHIFNFAYIFLVLGSLVRQATIKKIAIELRKELD